jgi:hypothetical protein
MAQKLLSWKTLNKRYGNISKDFRRTIEWTAKKILKKENGILIRFKEQVLIHFITDNVYADCRSIQLGDDGSLTFQVELHQDAGVDEYDDVLEDMDLASYYEILLALNEKEFVVEKQA